MLSEVAIICFHTNHDALKCLITAMSNPKTTALTSTIGTAFFSFLAIITTIGRAIKTDTIGPDKKLLTFNCGSVVLNIMKVTTTYWAKADQQFALSIFWKHRECINGSDNYSDKDCKY